MRHVTGNPLHVAGQRDGSRVPVVGELTEPARRSESGRELPTRRGQADHRQARLLSAEARAAEDGVADGRVCAERGLRIPGGSERNRNRQLCSCASSSIRAPQRPPAADRSARTAVSAGATAVRGSAASVAVRTTRVGAAIRVLKSRPHALRLAADERGQIRGCPLMVSLSNYERIIQRPARRFASKWALRRSIRAAAEVMSHEARQPPGFIASRKGGAPPSSSSR